MVLDDVKRVDDLAMFIIGHLFDLDVILGFESHPNDKNN